MKPGVPLPLGAVVTLLGFFLALQGCWQVGAEIGGRHIRRITAVDLPSSNSSDATKARLKKLQTKKGEDCTKSGSCNISTTAAPRGGPEGKTTSSFLDADVLQERLHDDILSYLTTSSSPFDGGYDSYFNEGDFDERSAGASKKSSFSHEHHSVTESVNFDTPLTTPRISLFDDVHARMTEGIRQNLEVMDNHAFPEQEQRHNDNAQQGHRAIAVTAQPPPTANTNEEVALEFLSKFSVVYNDSKIPFVRRDIVVENATHLDFERSRVHTEVEPEIDRTVYYMSNDTHSTVIPTFDIQNNTGTPGDKDSTTSGSTKDRFFSRSHEPRNDSSNEENRRVTSDLPVKLVILNDTNAEPTDSGTKSADKDALASSSAGAIETKDPESNAVRPVHTASNTNTTSRIFVSNRGRYNTTNLLQPSSRTPVSKSPENISSSEEPTKESRAKNHLRRTGTNRSEEQVHSNTTKVRISTEKSVLSTTLENASLSHPSANASNIQSEKGQILADGFTKQPEESSTTASISSPRSRNFPSRRPHTAAKNKTRENEAKNVVELSVVTPSNNSSSVNVQPVGRRLSTLKRRLQGSNTTPLTSTTSNDTTTESNAIIREFLTSSAQTSVLKNAPSTKTDNNEGNDIISFKSNVYKPVIRNRGSIRYGNQTNGTLEDIPPTAAVWALVTLRGRENKTASLGQENSTSDSSTKNLPSTRGRKPWSSQEQGSTTTAVEEATDSTPTTAKSTQLSPVIRVRGARPQKPTASSMQENRLSSVHVAAPTTDQASESTMEPTYLTESADSSTSLSVQFTTGTNSDAWYKQTETTVPGTSTVAGFSTGTDTDESYGSYAIPPSQVTMSMASGATDDTVTASTESLRSTTENYESSMKVENASAEHLEVVRLLTVAGFASSSYGERGSTTPTTQSLFPVTTKKENDQVQHETPSGEDIGTSYSTVSYVEEAIKQSVANRDTKLPEGDVHVSGNGDGRTESSSLESVYNEGDDVGGNSEEENKKTDDDHQVDDNESSGKPSVIPAGADEITSADSDGPQTAASDVTADVVSAGSTEAPDDDQTSTSTELVESFSTPQSEQSSIGGISTSAIEWGADSTIPSMFTVQFYLVLRINATWFEFCDHLEEFKQSVANLMRNNERPVETHQVIVPNAETSPCLLAATMLTPDIEVKMYLVDDSHSFDGELTSDFFVFWTECGLPGFPFHVTMVDPVGQTSDDVSDDEGGGDGMIAAIAISCIGAACLLLIAVLWLVMRKRQQKCKYGQRCTPVSLDAYSLDSVSVCGSVRHKGGRNSKQSYGNPGFDDPTSPSHPMGFAELANFVVNRNSLEEEFARIPQVTAKVDELPEGADTKNRYANVIPLPETQVHLSPREGEPLSDYINANFVHGPKNASKFYIACQAPMASTVTDFWRMIWEQQSKVVIMLTDLVENGVEKCVDYLPPSEVLDCHRLFGDFQVTLKKREVKDHYIISTLQLKNLDTNLWREVMHLWYVSWPIQGVPDDVSSVITFLLEARAYMRGGPCVVHCSPGTGRTGTVIACDLCIRDFETKRTVDIPRCVAQLRRDRAGAVQTRDQYVFIYQVINLYGTKLTGGALDSM